MATLTFDGKEGLFYDSALQETLRNNPKIKEAINRVYEINPNSSLFTGSAGNLSPVINNLAADISRLGSDTALSNFYKAQQNLAGFGQTGWLSGQDMGNPEWTQYQQIIQGLVTKANDTDWNKKAIATTGFGGDSRELGALWRDPTTGAGVSVLLDNNKRPVEISFYDRSGQKSGNTQTFTAEGFYQGAELAGIDLTKVNQIGSLLESKGINYKPNEVYANSDAGIDFTDISKGGLGSAYDWTVDPNAAQKYVPGSPSETIFKEQMADKIALAKRLGIKGAAGVQAQQPTAQQYFQANPDVAAAYAQNTFGLTPEQFANVHASLYGGTEQRNVAGTTAMGTEQIQGLLTQAEAERVRQGNEQYIGGLVAREPQAFQNLYNAIQTGNARISRTQDGGLQVLDAAGRPIEGVTVDPNTGQMIVGTSNGQLFLNTQIGQGGTLARIEPTEWNQRVQYQSFGNDWDQLPGILKAALIAGGGYLAAPLVGSALASAAPGALAAGTAANAAATGAILGGTGAALTGQNPLTGALLGGLGGYAFGGGTSGLGPQTDASFLAADAAQLAAQGLTESQIASVLGASGYGSTAAANLAASMAANGLSVADMTTQLGNLSQTTGLMQQNYSTGEMAAYDALGLRATVGNDFAAIEQNLIASGVDPLIAADISQQLAFNPNITQAEMASNLTGSFGGNIYDVNMAQTYPTSTIPGAGGLLSGAAGAAGPSATGTTPTGGTGTGTTGGTGLTSSQLANLIKAGVGLAGAGAAGSLLGGGGGGSMGVGDIPTQGVPINTPGYYQAIQQYYNAYMPEMPRNVATPLQQWYESKYGA